MKSTDTGLYFPSGRFVIAGVRLVFLAGILGSAISAPAQNQNPFRGIDLDTVFLGFSPDHPGSSAQIDFSLANHLLRFTAWASQPSDHYQDFSIDLDVDQVPSANWRLVGNHLSFFYTNSAQNTRLRGDFYLDPVWRGVLTVYPVSPSAPMAHLSSPATLQWVLVRAPLVADASARAGPRPLPFAAVNPVLSPVSIPASLLTLDHVTIRLDDGFSDPASATDVTGDFFVSGSEAVASNLPFRLGNNRLIFDFPDQGVPQSLVSAFGAGRFEVFSLHRQPDTAALLPDAVVNDTHHWLNEIDDEGRTTVVVKNAVNLIIGEDSSEDGISSFMRIKRQRPVGYASPIGLFNVLVYGRNLTPTDPNGASRLFNYVNNTVAEADPRIGIVDEDFALTLDDATPSAESIQASISVVGAENYTVARRGWALPDAATSNPRALGWAGEHFWMETFPAHKLMADWLDSLPENAPVNFPVIAVIDGGFGKEGFFPNNDMPRSNFFDLWSNVGTPSGDDAKLINAGPPVNALAPPVHRAIVDADFKDQRIWDNVVRGHGTEVAEFINAQGVDRKLGIGINNYVAIVKMWGLDDSGSTSLSWSTYTGAAALAEQRPEYRILNCSNGMGENANTAFPNVERRNTRTRESELLFDRLARAGVAVCISARNFTNYIAPLPALPAGTDFVTLPVPGMVAPVRGTRNAATATFELRNGGTVGAADGSTPLMMRVGGFILPDTAAGREVPDGANPPPYTVVVAGERERISGAGRGGNVSVVAYSDQLNAIQPLGDVRFNLGGTSFSTPTTAGLLGEIIRILDTAAGRTDPTTAAQRAAAARITDVRRAIELIEATSDRVIGTDRAANFKQNEQAPDDNMGFGRINAWKAVLSAINGGLAQGGTDRTGAGALTFGSLAALVDAAHTTYYGFSFRLLAANLNVVNIHSGATIWLNDNPFDDRADQAATLPKVLRDPGSNTDFTGANGGAGVRNIVAFKRTESLNVRTPAGFTPVTIPAGGGVTEMALSLKRTDLTPAAGISYKRLELRRNGNAATDQPFFSMPVRLATLRDNATNGTNVRFDDFVFETLGDHVVTFNRSEIRGIPAADAAGGEQELIVMLRNADNGAVAGTVVNFIVSDDKTGAEDPKTQIRLRATSGAAAMSKSLNVNTNASGDAHVFITRKKKENNDDGVVTRILVRVNTNSAAGAAAGMQFPQEFTFSVRP